MESPYVYYCVFTYDTRGGEETRTTYGNGCSWSDLCIKFDREGPPCPASNVIHFKTISRLGPKLFAVSFDTFKVFYHANGQWHQYQSARNVRLFSLQDLMKFLINDDDDTDEDLSQEDNDGKDRDEDEPSRQANDSHTQNDSRHHINQAILYYCLFWILPIVHLHTYYSTTTIYSLTNRHLFME
ncbi:unnamed protein product [Rotaria sordida]|uniref:Uncharacterized protein n=1 Tax=Rotaria sordida TaxID=392033 RepID=A0A815N5F0_9BILA|nr:unnamed protein product [Rotaria sordida]CAF1432718.1 unnamed protein product [Rotaria sordida]CAF3582772.1 unnamed protein product [Rotaria sordida]CAF4042434.1 unnamed protein product [Rotaria sordida]